MRADAAHDTFWLTQQQVADIFDVQKAAISKHVKNIFNSGELEQKATVSKMETVQTEGVRHVKRNIEYYNLDLVLSVGYRVNSMQATRFRQWATKTLKNHILKGYTINRHRIRANHAQFLEAVENIKQLLPAGAHIDTESVLELISVFADTWLSLNAYDKDTLIVTGTSKKHVALTAEKLSASLLELKVALMEKGEATDLFGQERSAGSVAGVVGNVLQSFDSKELYETVEEKAAHLLYFMVKNHPFIDGNKRNGAYAFVWFLRQAKILDVARMTPSALTALTILVAESNSKDKEKVVKLILMLLVKGKKINK